MHDRLQPDDRAFRNGRHGFSRDERRSRLPPGRRKSRAHHRLRLCVRPSAAQAGIAASADAQRIHLQCVRQPVRSRRSARRGTRGRAMKRRWGVVGGGMLGLTLAHRIRQSGDDVTVLEESADCGGLASPWKLGDVTWDRHYHVTLYSDLALRSLLSELQLESRMDWVTTRTGFFTDGRLYSFSDVMDFVRFPPLNPLQKARLAATILHASRITDWHSLERITALEWLRRYSGAQTVEKIWHPLLRAKLGANAEKASAAFIWAIIARMYAARRTGMKRELFGYVPGGYSTILARYVEVLRESGVEIVTGSRVQSVTPASGDRVRVLASDGSERE